MIRSCSEMAEICLREKETSTCTDSNTRAARRKRMEIRRVKYVTGVSATVVDHRKGMKKPKFSISTASSSREPNDVVDNCSYSELKLENGDKSDFVNECIPKFGAASVCGRRREMEDSVAIHPWFLDEDTQTSNIHYFGVYDGHGCSHVARRCKDRLHLLVKEELNKDVDESTDWKNGMERSFSRMDEEVVIWNQQATSHDCKCELHAPESYGVGSTAVVAVVTPDKIVVANCGDSRAVLCRNGKPVPLSVDHKPDRPDELSRIQAAGGRVLYWEGARVCGVLAMSRAIGDNYLKPYVTSEPEVTVTDRTEDDEFLILASDGLWDVVSNETACGLASMCLKGNGPSAKMKCPPVNDVPEYTNSDGVCSDASLLLTKLALARRSADNVSVIVVDLRKAA
ncbi:probable protein phosphatase 2C 24 [Rutidosis leptorrhynchoides]|uniref:probable protein phosphatase 2C 24 n=1 Tax=Rutidosis leptorrhynchoides TaxID=125765 RepID=UPI003A9927E7